VLVCRRAAVVKNLLIAQYKNRFARGESDQGFVALGILATIALLGAGTIAFDNDLSLSI
jgi:uncharacterized membrane protein YhiD involved in acid resistance